MEGMDLLQGLQEAEAEAAGPQLPPNLGEFKMPSMEQMLDLLSQMDLPEDEKQKLMEGFTNKAEVMRKLAGQGATRISHAMSPNDSFLGSSFGDSLIFFAAICCALVVVFFGYKLYKSLVDKERKRQEKRKLKAQKKKK